MISDRMCFFILRWNERSCARTWDAGLSGMDDSDRLRHYLPNYRIWDVCYLGPAEAEAEAELWSGGYLIRLKDDGTGLCMGAFFLRALF